MALASRIPDIDGPRSLPIFTIKVNGLALSRETLPLSVRVQKEANRIPTAHLVFSDGDPTTSEFKLSDKALFAPGSRVEISAGYMGRAERVLFKGLVIRQAIEGRPGGQPRLTVTCKDAFVKTTLAPQRRYYTKQTDSQIARAIVGRYGGLAVQAGATSVTHPELVQYDATDWDFLLLRAAANGQLAFVSDGRLTLAKPELSQVPAVKLLYGATVLSFDAEVDARDQVAGLSATAWDPAKGAPATAKATEEVRNALGNLSSRELGAVHGAAPVLRYDGALPADELQAWANATLARHRLAKVRGRVQFYGNAAVKPGTTLRLDGLGKRFSGLAYVTGVSHRIEQGAWVTDAQLGLDPRALAASLPGGPGSAEVSPPPAGGLVPGLRGLQLGVVTALAGDPAGEERILVRLPLVDPAADGTRARLLSVDAGKERGFFFRPEVGDEVVVGFLHDDPRQAVVLGALHGSRHPVPPPFKTADANNLKGYVSRSKLQVVFDDEKKTLTLTTPGGNLLKLDDEAKGITLQDQHGNKIVLGQEGISLESSKAIILKATTDAKLSAQNVGLEAQAQLKATGAGGVELSSSATAVLKGATVMIN
jgi:Rhs element Vgr protein